MIKNVEADYLIIGGGASAMAFVDTMLSESDATFIIVDKQASPGGHWNHAYSFVTLHQPSAFYGVPSKELSKGVKDQIGLNKGLNELASGAEIVAYYGDLMRERFLPSGRVQYFPLCEYTENGHFHSLMTGEQFKATFKKKSVNTTYFKTSIPATHTPAFDIDESVNFIPLNGLVNLTEPAEGFTIVGGGKTGIDAVLWLLEQNIDPDNISWIMPRDAWFLDRKNTQPTEEFFEDAIGAQARQFEAIAAAESQEDMFLRLEKAGVLLRLDPQITPKMFHGATVSQLELEQMRRIKNIVRMGRVTHIQADKIILEQGEIATSSNRVHVDCTASAISNLETRPVFENKHIYIQTVRSYQPTFSASFIAHIENNYDDEEKKNKLCSVVPLPNHLEDFVDMTYRNLMNQYFWSKEPGIKAWLKANRLDGFMRLVDNVKFYEFGKLKILNRMRLAAKPAVAKLKAFRDNR